MKKGTKALFMVLALMLALCIGIGGTLAYLSVQTGDLVNTFTYGDINIELWENDYILSSNSLDISKKVMAENDYKMVPGTTMPKNPTVTVKANSEACYLFIKVVKTNNPDTYLDYTIDTSIWTALVDTNNDSIADDGVYYREVDAATANQDFTVLTDNEVTVNSKVTKEQLTAISTNYPTLTFTAYAVQKANVADAAAAWNIINTPVTP